MFKHYFVTALRSAKKDTMGFFINLLGLITGFVVFSFAFAFVNFEKNYDSFWENSDRIVKPGSKIINTPPFNSDKLPGYFSGVINHIDTEFPEIEKAAQVIEQKWPLKVGNDSYHSSFRIVDPAFFDIFKLTFIEGGPEGLSTNPEAALLSRSEAIKLFGSPALAMGQTFQVKRTMDVKVVGVFENLPLNSHFVSYRHSKPFFNIILSSLAKDALGLNFFKSDWNFFGMHIYMLLAPNTDRTTLSKHLDEFSKNHLTGFGKDFFIGVLLPSLEENNIINWEHNNILLLSQTVGSIILLIAVFNAISLNSTRMISRSGEIAMRRILGASRAELITQFIAENLIITLTALILSLFLLWGLEPIISSLLGRQLNITSMMGEGLLLFLFLIAICVGILSTAYPIYLLWKVGADGSLGQSTHKSSASSWLRQGLAGLQFIVVSALIFSVVIAAKQNQFMRDSAPKFRGEQIVAITGLKSKEAREKLDLIETRLTKLPGVTMVSRSNLPPFSGTTFMYSMILPNTPKDAKAELLTAINMDPNYLSLHDIKLVSGRNLSFDRSNDNSTSPPKKKDKDGKDIDFQNTFLGNILVNEMMVKKMGFSSNKEALEANIIMDAQNLNYLTVVGVVEDKRLAHIEVKKQATIFRYQPKGATSFSVIHNSPHDIDFEAIKATWSNLLPGEKVLSQTLDVAIDQNMEKRDQQYNLVMTISLIALILANSGLYALAAHMATSRQKEVGIRKVLGAKPRQIIKLFMIQFSKPLIIALLIGLPLGAWMMEEFYLKNTAIRIDIDLTMALTATAITLAIGWATVFIHILRASRTHPNDVLHYE